MEESKPNEQSTDQKDITKTNEKKDLSRKLEAMGWALFFIWVGISFLTSWGAGIVLLGIGVITLGMQLIRTFFEMKIEAFWIVIGVLFVIGGLGILLNINIPLEPIVLILAGVIIIFYVFRKK
ncbi:hypothetical protein ACFLS9_00805 [Bacteroidota bacterium]